MCGILGSVGFFGKEKFKKALGQLTHRGPDGESVWFDDAHQVILGHRRLSIIDISDSGRQPMRDGYLTITYNGEIYNYIELKKILQDKGHVFKSTSDTEVILKSYQEWGVRCVEKFNGMWAFAIWNENTKRLFIARDRFGVKPLFYAFSSKGFLFGSEMKAIAPLLDHIELSSDFTWCLNNIYSYETSERSLIQGIKRFPAGHVADYTPGDKTLIPKRYWDTLDHIKEETGTYPQQVENFRALFLDACKIRMRSDVKIGTSLSGGLDSSSVAAAMSYWGNQTNNNQNIQSEWQNAFVATFKGTYLDESEYAEEVINSLKLKGHFYEINASEGIEKLNSYLWFFEELFLTSPIPMTNIYKAIKSEGISVSLDGHGADELLAGYSHTIFNAVKDQPFNVSSIKEIADTYKKMHGVNKSDLEVVIDGFSGRKNMLLFYLRKLLQINPEDELTKRIGFFNAALYKEFHFYILPTLLRNYDRYSMAGSVEVRMPFMDYRLVTQSFSLPWQSKIRNGFSKAILRDAMEPFLSPLIVKRKSKIGFGTPFTDWFRGPWKKFTMDLVHSESFNNSSVIDSRQVHENTLKFFHKENPDAMDGHEVWKDLMPYLWEISFFKKLKIF